MLTPPFRDRGPQPALEGDRVGAPILARTSVGAAFWKSQSQESGTVLQHCWGRDQPSLGQHLPALRARRMVREGSSPPPERRSLPDPLCGRLCDRGCPRRRRPANHGGLAQADEQVRLDGPPGEDATGAVPTAPDPRLRNRGSGTSRNWDIRLLGIYPLLGSISARRMGGQTEDGEEPTQARARSAVGMVPKKSAPCDQGAAPETHAKTARPLRVLRDYWQLLQPSETSGGSATDLAMSAVSASPRQANDVAQIPSSGEAIQSSPRPSSPRLGGRRSEVMR